MNLTQAIEAMDHEANHGGAFRDKDGRYGVRSKRSTHLASRICELGGVDHLIPPCKPVRPAPADVHVAPPTPEFAKTEKEKGVAQAAGEIVARVFATNGKPGAEQLMQRFKQQARPHQPMVTRREHPQRPSGAKKPGFHRPRNAQPGKPGQPRQNAGAQGPGRPGQQPGQRPHPARRHHNGPRPAQSAKPAATH